MKKILFPICAILILQLTLLNAQTNHPTIEKNGKKYYEYTIQQGDGLFSIARKFNIKQNDLHEANENLSTEIKIGDKILIPIKETNENTTTKAITTHVVEAKQTLYSISKLYNISIDTLITLNPSAKTGIKEGEVLIISNNKQIEKKQTNATKQNINPKVNNITHLVQNKETLYSISKKYNVAIHDLINLNPELKNGLKTGTTITIKEEKIIEYNPIITTDTISSNTTNEETNITYTPLLYQQDTSLINIAYLLPLIPENQNEEKNIQRFIEFYRGSILALNKAKQEGISANIYTYNLPKSTNKIDSILQIINEKKIDILIGPAYSEQLTKVLTYTKENNITTIVPFSNKIDTTLYFPKLIQFNPPQDSLFPLILKNTFEHRNLQYILAHFEQCNNKGELFINELKNLLTTNNKEFKEINIKPEYTDSLISMITNDTTILFLGSSLINDVAPIIDSLNQHQLPQLQIWGFEEWGTNIIKKYPQTLYYSLFFPNETDEYKTNYKNWFGTRKQSVSVKYDLLGYDLTTLALKGINISNNTITILDQTPNYLQSEPKLNFINNRLLNTNYYLLYWNNIIIKNINN